MHRGFAVDESTHSREVQKKLSRLLLSVFVAEAEFAPPFGAASPVPACDIIIRSYKANVFNALSCALAGTRLNANLFKERKHTSPTFLEITHVVKFRALLTKSTQFVVKHHFIRFQMKHAHLDAN